VLSFQLRNRFEVIGSVPDYIPNYQESLNYGVHMVWRNPKVPERKADTKSTYSGGRLADTVRVGTVQYMLRRVHSFEEFIKFVEYFVDVVATYNGDFVVFPELFTLQLLSIENQEMPPAEAIGALTEYTPARSPPRFVRRSMARQLRPAAA